MKYAVTFIILFFVFCPAVTASDLETDIENLEDGYESISPDIGGILHGIFSFDGIIGNIVYLGGVSFLSAVMTGKGENKTLRYAFSAAAMGIISFPVLDAFSAVRKFMSVFSSFLTASAPVAMGLSAASGKAVSGSVSYSFTVLLVSLVSAFSEKLLFPVIGFYTALCSISGLSDGIDIKSFCSLIHKGAVLILSVFATAFTAVFIIKSKVAAVSDSVALRGIKFTVSSAFPVVGSALSDALASAGGYFSGLSGSMRLLGVGVLAAAFLPVCRKTLYWIITLAVSSAVSGIFGDRKTEILLSGLKGSFSLMWSISALFFFMAFVLICLV